MARSVDQGFIPWDDDIDIAMLRRDYDRFIEVAQLELSDKYYLMGPEFDRGYYNLKPHLVLKNTVFITDEAWASVIGQGFFLIYLSMKMFQKIKLN